MNKEEIEELKDFTIDITDIDELALGLEVCSKKSNMVIQEFADTIIQLQQENKQLREKVNKFNIDKINNENKSLKGSCKILGEKNNNQRKELQRLNNKIEKLKVINEEHKKLNGELREENQKYKEAIDRAIEYLEAKRIREKAIVDIDVLEGILKEVE